MRNQIQIPIGNLPVQLVLLWNRQEGGVVFVKSAPVGLIVENHERGKVSAIFDEEGFSIGDEDFSYNTIYNYKSIPLMLEWLQQQNLQQPSISFVG